MLEAIQYLLNSFDFGPRKSYSSKRLQLHHSLGGQKGARAYLKFTGFGFKVEYFAFRSGLGGFGDLGS